MIEWCVTPGGLTHPTRLIMLGIGNNPAVKDGIKIIGGFAADKKTKLKDRGNKKNIGGKDDG